MKLDFMTWVIINTDYTVEEINNHWFKVYQKSSLGTDVWVSRDGSEIDDPRLATRTYYEIKSFKYPPERWAKITELLIKYHGGTDEAELHDLGDI